MPLDFIGALAELRPLEGVEPERMAAIQEVQGGLVRLAILKLQAIRDSQDIRAICQQQEQLNRRGMELLGLWEPGTPPPRS